MECQYRLPGDWSHGVATLSGIVRQHEDHTFKIFDKCLKVCKIAKGFEEARRRIMEMLPKVALTEEEGERLLASMLEPKYYFRRDGSWYLIRKKKQDGMLVSAVFVDDNRPPGKEQKHVVGSLNVRLIENVEPETSHAFEESHSWMRQPSGSGLSFLQQLGLVGPDEA